MSILVINQTDARINGVYQMYRKVPVLMRDLPRLWEEDFDKEDKFFTVGARGRRHYCLWTWGPCGLAYCYAVDPDTGHACCRRQVEPDREVYLWVQDNLAEMYLMETGDPGVSDFRMERPSNGGIPPGQHYLYDKPITELIRKLLK